MSSQSAERVFRYRLDIYWRALALYLLALIGYGFVRGGVSNGHLTVALTDPVVLLLSVFVVWSAAVLLWIWYRSPTVGVGEDYIRLRNRFRERFLRLQDIEWIGLPRWRRGWGRFVRIRLKGGARPRIILMRPAAYERSQELLQEFVRLSRRLRGA
ncbi:MAG: hypothetical protein NZ473_04465 [Candidatus Kapabacteria bacterium]|nr:hypothetical protein [Candidatus Kapabacteria bacterium]MCS7169084.1 hypothetical protein [Candidatus Kapabacteria bacterium]MDW7996819.1 hypothetical protein [Bacteroidota bacterium]MDW8224440.1 hypothetical protein [Bacteroidota bacterium]